MQETQVQSLGWEDPLEAVMDLLQGIASQAPWQWEEALGQRRLPVFLPCVIQDGVH